MPVTTKTKNQKPATAKAKGGARGASSRSVKLKDPKGGLTAAGRKHFAETEGAHLKAGVLGAADTPEKQRRKGSFLRRFYGRAEPSPLTDAKGEPTRYAKAASAWGESVPRTKADVKKLAKKGQALLERYAKAKPPARARKASH